MNPEFPAVGSPPDASTAPAVQTTLTPEPASAAPAPLAPAAAGEGPSRAGDRAPPEGRSAARWAPESYALVSALIPGAGQAAQGRWVTAAIQAGTVASYLVGALVAGGGRAFWLALGWNAWSAIDAYWHERD